MKKMRYLIFLLLTIIVTSCSITRISFDGMPRDGFHSFGKSIYCKKAHEIGYWKNDTLIYSLSIYKGKSIIINDSFHNFQFLKGDTSAVTIMDTVKFKDLDIKQGFVEKYNSKSVGCGRSYETGRYFVFNEKLKNDSIIERFYIFDRIYNLLAIAENVNSEYIIQYYFTKKKTTTFSLTENDKHYYLDENSCVKRTKSNNKYIYKINRNAM